MLRTFGEKNHKAAVRKANGHQSWPASPTTNTSLVMDAAMTQVRIGTSLPKCHTIIRPI